uniref:DUF7086 domain-containing protein n=1 Tax=Nelumbo nucifera TaxID=4432 RepID=A0A822YD98_NELNU|nr:TPA_asm: hypothetical protein HUJ06_028936 [Nelumbo nucifera]
MSTLAPQESRPSRPLCTRRNPRQAPRRGKSEVITPPYPWATNHRATVYSLHELLSMGIHVIPGEVKCKRCEHQYLMEFQLESKFTEVAAFITARKSTMHDRAPREWMYPLLPTCRHCEQVNSARPIIDRKKRKINWLFLLLGRMLGCCNLNQLKYFCKHTKNHRTGAKDRVLYLTYLGLCKQLDPTVPQRYNLPTLLTVVLEEKSGEDFTLVPCPMIVWVRWLVSKQPCPMILVLQCGKLGGAVEDAEVQSMVDPGCVVGTSEEERLLTERVEPLALFCFGGEEGGRKAWLRSREK